MSDDEETPMDTSDGTEIIDYIDRSKGPSASATFPSDEPSLFGRSGPFTPFSPLKRSEPLPFIDNPTGRPRRHQKETDTGHFDLKNTTPIPSKLYERVCYLIKESFNGSKKNPDLEPNEILNYDTLNLFITYGFRFLTSIAIESKTMAKITRMDVTSTNVSNRDESETHDDDDDGDTSDSSGTLIEEIPSAACSACGLENCNCHSLAKVFLDTTRHLSSHENFFKIMAEAGLYKILKAQITARVEEQCLGKWFSKHINELLTWLNALTPWVQIVSPKVGDSGKMHMVEELKTFLLEIIGNTIITELFAIIIEFPESRPVLDDLKYCLRKVPLRKRLVSSLKLSLERRLLNPGVNTSDLLDAYVSTVKALKYVDPSGILVQLVTPPIREYLKSREETVRVILVSLTEETGDLAEELARNPVNLLNRDLSYWEDWKPDPIDVPKDQYNLRRSDLIHTILSIYGSKTLFMDEYRALLADRLLKMPKPRPVSHEIKCLELLKLRFGEHDLQKCEVMLKDVADSHRLNVRFHEEEGAVLAHQDIPVTGLIISAQFWPNLKQESLLLPKEVETSLAIYTKAFEMIKGNRSLEWQKHIGFVQFEMELNGVKLKFSVSPALATILWHFQEKEQWKMDDLCTVTGLSKNVLKSRIAFWLSKGIVREVEDIYQLNDNFSVDGAGGAGHVEEVMDSHMTSASAQREQELQMFWSYIEGMLSNLESLPLSRIFSMLKLFATVECSLEDVQKFLDQKVGMGVLIYSNGNYKVPK